MMCGTNPVEYVVEKATGDREAVSKAGDALIKLTDFNGSFGTAVGDGKEAMLAGWTGEAANAAGTYFDTIPAALSQQLEALRSAGQGRDARTSRRG